MRRTLPTGIWSARPDYTSPVSVDDALKTTFRNFATLFFVVAALTVPVHVVHAFVYRDVIAVRDIHDAVEDLDPRQQVRGVTADDLVQYRTTGWLIAAAEIALIPVLAGAARTVLVTRDSVSVGTAWKRWLGGWREPLPRLASHPATVLVVGAVIGVAVAFLLRSMGYLLSEPVGEAVAFGPVGLTEGVARATGAPFLLVPLALAAGRAKGDA
jgi:hypothetical protein